MPELQRALGALAFSPRSRCSRYAPLFEDSAWQVRAAAGGRWVPRTPSSHCWQGSTARGARGAAQP
jgi:hypothetical protein